MAVDTIIERDVIEVSILPPIQSGNYLSRKLNGACQDDDFDRRPQRRRYEEPITVRIRKQVLSIAESVCTTHRIIWFLIQTALY